MLTGIADRSCFMDQCEKRIKLFIKEYFFPEPAEYVFLNGSDSGCVHEEVQHNPLVYQHRE